MPAFASDAGRRLPSEKREIIDKVTGLKITVLTTDPANDHRIYQTHPQWTADGKWIVFRSNRAADKRVEIFAVNEQSGEIVQLTDGPETATGSINVARKSMKLYYFRGPREGARQLIELELDPLLGGSPDRRDRVVMTMPADLPESGGFTLDADEKVAYIGVGVPNQRERGGIRSIDLTTGQIKTVIDVNFRMGHVQASPYVSGEIVYCHETGGDAPQRIWLVNVDGSGNRSLYKETADEWVTHESFVDKDTVIFNILGHQSKLRTKPTGIAVINLRNDEMKILGQVDEGRGFWHCNGSSDGRWAAGDTFSGNVYLIDRKSGQITLLTTDHKMRPDHAHPSFSPDNTRVLFSSGQLSDGKSLDLMVVDIPQNE